MSSHACGLTQLGGRLNSSCPPANLTMSDDTSIHKPYQRVIELYLISIFCAIGILGNSLSLVVLRRDDQRHRGLVLLQGLSAADTFYLLMSALRYPAKYFISDHGTYLQTQIYIFPLLKVAQSVCIWMMVLVTIDRYIHVCHPLRATRIHPRYRKVGLWLLCIAACLFNSPRFFDSCIMTFQDMCTLRIILQKKVYMPMFNSKLYFDLYNCVAYIVLLYVGPLLILSVLNCRLIKAIRHSMKRQRRFGAHNETSDNNATLVLVIIVITFILCETPELILKTVTFAERRWYPALNLPITTLGDLSTTNEFLMVINSAANFFIYCVFGKRFRYLLRTTLCSKGGIRNRKQALVRHAHQRHLAAVYQMKPLVTDINSTRKSQLI